MDVLIEVLKRGWDNYYGEIIIALVAITFVLLFPKTKVRKKPKT